LYTHYNNQNRLLFHQFPTEFHAHFDALYGQIGIKPGTIFGGNEKGAVKIFPTGINTRKGIIYVRLIGRGIWDGLNERQSIAASSCQFLNEEGEEVNAESAIAWHKAEQAEIAASAKEDKCQERERKMPEVFRNVNRIHSSSGIRFVQTLWTSGRLNPKCDGVKNADLSGIGMEGWNALNDSTSPRSQMNSYGIIDGTLAIVLTGLYSPAFLIQATNTLKVFPIKPEEIPAWLERIKYVAIMETRGMAFMGVMYDTFELEA